MPSVQGGGGRGTSGVNGKKGCHGPGNRGETGRGYHRRSPPSGLNRDIKQHHRELIAV